MKLSDGWGGGGGGDNNKNNNDLKVEYQTNEHPTHLDNHPQLLMQFRYGQGISPHEPFVFECVWKKGQKSICNFQSKPKGFGVENSPLQPKVDLKAN
jgi:hypothetical protein